MKTRNKIFLAGAALFFGLTAAADDFNSGYLKYTTTNSTSVTVSGFADDAPATITDLVIPIEVTNGSTTYKVAGVKSGALSGTRLKGNLTINMMSANSEIANNAFQGCTGLNGTVTVYSHSTTGSIGTSSSLGFLKPLAFNGCSNIKEIVLVGAANSSFNGSAFNGCTSVEKVVVISSTLSYPMEWFPTEITNNATLIVPEAIHGKVSSTTGWMNFKKTATAESQLEELSLPTDFYLETWEPVGATGSGGKYPIDFVIKPDYLRFIIKTASENRSDARITYSEDYSQFYVRTDRAYSEDFVKDVKVTMTIGDQTREMTVHMGKAKEPEPAKDVVVSFRYNSNTGFTLRHTIKSTDNVDFHVTPHIGGWKVDYIEKRFTDETNGQPDMTDTGLITRVDKLNPDGRYTETEPVGEKPVTYLVKLSRNTEDEPTTGVGTVETETSFAVNVNGNVIEVLNAPENADLVVTNLAGQTVYSGKSMTVKVAEAGIYIVTVGNESVKVAVR